MTLWQPTAVPTAMALALAACFPPLALAQSNEALLKELRELKARVNELEARQKAIEAKGDSGQWRMTPAQQADLARVTVKTGAIEDNRAASGLQGLKISGQIQTAYIYNQAQDLAGFQFLDAVATYGYNYSYIGMAMISFEKEMEGGTRWKLSLAPQRGVGATIDGASVVQEASVSVPLTERQTRFDHIDNSKNGGGLLGFGSDNVNGIGPDANLKCETPDELSGCDKGANRYALSVGLRYVFNEFTTFKAEYRYDWSNLNVLENVSDGAYRKNNNILGASVVLGF